MKKMIIIIVVLIVVIGVGAYFLGKKSNEKITEPAVVENQEVDTSTKGSLTEQIDSKEEASGIIKSVYSKDGKDYLDIDYIEWNPDWAPGGGNGSAYQNNNPKIRTFEISQNTQFILGSPATNLVTFSEFKKAFVYKNGNPWDIIVVNGVVTQIKEHFLP